MYPPIFITTREDHSIETGIEPLFRLAGKIFKRKSRSRVKVKSCKPQCPEVGLRPHLATTEK